LRQMGSKNAHRWTPAEEAKETFMGWLNRLVVNFHDGDHQAWATSGQILKLVVCILVIRPKHVAVIE
jgi:hypothetical protein